MPKSTNTIQRMRNDVEEEAARRGVPVRDVLRELTTPMVPVYTRIRREVFDALTAEAQRRGMSRADLVRERIENGGAR